MSTSNDTLIGAAQSQATEFWSLVIDVWNTSFLGASVGQGLLAMVAVIAALFLRGMISRWLVSAMRRVVRKTANQLDDAVVDALAGPFQLIPVIIGLFIATTIVGLGGPESIGARLVQSLIAITMFWALHNAVTPVSRSLDAIAKSLTPVMIDWMTKSLQILFVIVGAAAVLEIWSIPVGPIIAGLGLFGVAVGLGAQDLFKNLIAGVLILTERRFLPGDWVQVDGVVEGTVEKINFRSTVVRRFDKGPVYVPNSKLSDNAVTNFSRMTHRRISWAIGVEYKTTTEQLAYIRDKTLGYILGHPEFAKPPEVTTFMRVDAFGPSSIDFKLYAFTVTTNWTEWLRIKEELAFELKKIVEESGTAFAFPSQTIYVDDGSEVFLPPESNSRQKIIQQPANPGEET
ncbi:mechanosensitive ion channel family protein [Hyphobacterium sp. CCMP332]|uniref:mechanosensitive ion channel family protein n=1 Tax=Hyphobacterium sp. CCMP332 TaxID=2749086 RepID=UPI001F24A593|nr:mechanosensitive ion channel domain-containing protein [Hyphobacterium sp. CCMP332]